MSDPQTPTFGPGHLDRIADRAYLVGVLALGLLGGHWLADRGPSKTDALEAKVGQLSSVVDSNSKAVNDYAGQVNGRLAAVEQALKVPTPAPAKK